jgi:hypothetical protein
MPMIPAPALEQALLALEPSALEALPGLLSAVCRGKRREAADALEELTRRQVFETAQRAKRDGRGRPVPVRAPRRLRAPAGDES